MKNGWRVVPASLVFAMVIPWLAGCKNSLVDRSLIFATHTTIGLEVAVSPSQTDSPAKILIGYKRSEMVLNPVYHSEGVESPAMTDTKVTTGTGSAAKVTIVSEPVPNSPASIKRYRHEAYSVLAKIATKSGAKAGTQADASMAISQWFATGQAAIILAKNPATAGALAGSSSLGRNLESQLSPVGSIYNDAAVLAVYKVLKDLGDQGDRGAASSVAALDALAEVVPETYLRYTIDPTSPAAVPLTERTVSRASLVQGGSTPYEIYRGYVASVEKSGKNLDRALETDAFDFTPANASKRTVPVSPGDRDRVYLRSQSQVFKTLMPEIVQADERDAAITAAVAYYAKMQSK